MWATLFVDGNYITLYALPNYPEMIFTAMMIFIIHPKEDDFYQLFVSIFIPTRSRFLFDFLHCKSINRQFLTKCGVSKRNAIILPPVDFQKCIKHQVF